MFGFASACALDAGASALATVAREVSESIKDVPAGTVVVAAPTVSDVPGARTDDLSIRVAGLVAGRLAAQGKRTKPHERTLPLAAARAAVKDGASLLFLTPTIDKGRLAVAADLYTVPKNSWDRLRMPALAPGAHGFGSSLIDAEVRAFLPPIVLEQAAITRFKIDDPDVMAVACGDGNGDGALEVALVSRNKVTVGRFGQGQFRPMATAPWPELAPRLPVPLRDPIATASFDEDRLLVGTTDRGGVSVGIELRAASRLRGLPVNGVGVVACATPVPAAGALEGAGPCSPVGPGIRFAVPVPRFDGISAARVVARDGAVSQVFAVREPQGKIRIRFGTTDADVRIVSGGPELAVYDFDLDGAVDLATSADIGSAGGEDAISITSFARGVEPRLRRRIPVPSPVRALAACPPEVKGSPGLVAVVGSEVWLVR